MTYFGLVHNRAAESGANQESYGAHEAAQGGHVGVCRSHQERA